MWKSATQQVWKPPRRIVHTAALVLLLKSVALLAQTSQFLFDDNGNLNVQMPDSIVPPQITGQPQNQIVSAGELAAFSVIVADPRQLTYQWRFNGTDLSGENGVSLLLDNVSTNNEGEYRVVLTNPSGSVTSAPALLMIDNDGDDVADSWELTHFGNLDQTATADSDSDGVSNLQEFQDGTDPTDPTSARYRLLVIRDGGAVVKTFDQVSYTNGEMVTLMGIAVPNGEPFHAWLGDIVTRSNPVTLVMTNNKTIYARFTPIDFLWTNLAGGDWNLATNWTPNLVPGSNDSVVITVGATVTLNTSADCHDVSLGSAVTSPTLTGSGTLTAGGSFSWERGTMSGNGRTIIAPGATLNIAPPSGNSAVLNGRTLENGGTVLWTGVGSITLGSGAVITNRPAALFHIQDTGSLAVSGGVARFDNAGTFRKSVKGNTTTLAGVAFNNAGTVELQTGGLLWTGGFTNNGVVSLSEGTTNRLAGGGSAGGTFSAAASALVEWSAGTFALDSSAQLNGAGIYRINGGTITANADLMVENLDLFLGTFSGPSTVTISNVMNWTGGTMSGSGRTLIPVSATLYMANPSGVTLTTRTLENGGTMLWTGAGSLALNNGVITNRPGALFQVESAAALANNSGSPRFDNAGAFRKSGSTGTLTVGVSFNNFGSVAILAGTLLCNGSLNNSGAVNLSANTTNRLSGNGSASGAFTAPATALVEWTSGFTLIAGAQLNGAGLYKLNGGTFTGNTGLTMQNLDLNLGTLAGTGTVTVNNAMNWTAGTMSGSGRTIIVPGASLNVGSVSGVTLARTMESGGTVVWTGAGNFSLDAGAVITNRVDGLFHAQNAASLSLVGSSGTRRFDNVGTFRKSASTGTTTVANGISFNNTGTVEIQTGALSLLGGGTHEGSFTVPAGTALTLSGTHAAAANSSFTGAGQFVVSGGAPALSGLVNVSGSNTFSGGTANLTGKYFCTNNTLTISGGTANFDGSGLVSPVVVNLSNGTLGGSNVVTVANVMNWTGGSMSGSGRTVIPPGASLNVATASGVTLSRTLENGGTVLWTGAGGFAMGSGAIITNSAGGLFQVQNATPLVLVGSGGTRRFDNAGTFRKSASTGSTTIQTGVPFTNYGTVDIRSGILAANGGYASSSNALLNCALGGTSPGTNYGQLQVAGTVTLNGSLSVDLINGFTPAVNDSFTVLTAGTRNGSFSDFFFPSNTVTMQMSNTPTSVVLLVTNVFSVVPSPLLVSPEIIGPDVKLTWTSVSNAMYRVEFNPDLANLINWTALPGDVTAVTNTASKLDPLTPSNRLYRVRVLP